MAHCGQFVWTGMTGLLRGSLLDPSIFEAHRGSKGDPGLGVSPGAAP
jgi:hypothetical protein